MMAVERRVRIGDWLIPYDDATDEITLARTLADILAATPGDPTACMNAQCIQAQRNQHVFPHPVYVVSTIKTRVYIVDELNDAGDPSHAVRYELGRRDSALINAHDKLGAGETGVLRLRVPRDPKGSPLRAQYENRYAETKVRYSGDGKEKRKVRPVTGPHGEAGRWVAAVGGLREQAKA